MMPIDRAGIEEKVELVEKVSSHSLSYYILIKSANIYHLAGDKQKALERFKDACLFKDAENCQQLAKELEDVAANSDDDLRWINLEFQQWRRHNPEKTRLDIQ